VCHADLCLRLLSQLSALTRPSPLQGQRAPPARSTESLVTPGIGRLCPYDAHNSPQP
jgi:hypothetical protein